MATATATRRGKAREASEVAAATLAVTHLRGCPVAADPTDPELAARVEVYRDGPYVVTHCMECGALSYS